MMRTNPIGTPEREIKLFTKAFKEAQKSPNNIVQEHAAIACAGRVLLAICPTLPAQSQIDAAKFVQDVASTIIPSIEPGSRAQIRVYRVFTEALHTIAQHPPAMPRVAGARLLGPTAPQPSSGTFSQSPVSNPSVSSSSTDTSEPLPPPVIPRVSSAPLLPSEPKPSSFGTFSQPPVAQTPTSSTAAETKQAALPWADIERQANHFKKPDEHAILRHMQAAPMVGDLTELAVLHLVKEKNLFSKNPSDAVDSFLEKHGRQRALLNPGCVGILEEAFQKAFRIIEILAQPGEAKRLLHILTFCPETGFAKYRFSDLLKAEQFKNGAASMFMGGQANPIFSRLKETSPATTRQPPATVSHSILRAEPLPPSSYDPRYSPMDLEYITPGKPDISIQAQEFSNETAKSQLDQEFRFAQEHMQSQRPLPDRDFVESANRHLKMIVDNHGIKKPLFIDMPKESIGTRWLGIAHTEGRRDEMEDEHVAGMCTSTIQGKKVSYPIFGVIDGHGGERTAKFLKARFASEVSKAMSKYCADGVTDKNVMLALWEACICLDQQAIARESGELYSSGAVAVISIQIGSDLWTLNVGDTRGILVMQYGEDGPLEIVQVSEDGSPKRDKDGTPNRFAQEVLDRGGKVEKHTDRYGNTYRDAFGNVIWRADGFGPAQAFNDAHGIGKKTGYYVLSARPKIVKVNLDEQFQKYAKKHGIQNPDPKQFKIVGAYMCDGITDVGTTKQIAMVIKKQKMNPTRSAKKLIDGAVANGSTDNCSVVIVPFTLDDGSVPSSSSSASSSASSSSSAWNLDPLPNESSPSQPFKAEQPEVSISKSATTTHTESGKLQNPGPSSINS